MATLLQLDQRKTVQRITVPLDRGQQPSRALYGLPSFLDWLRTDLPRIVSDRNLDETPKQQMMNLAITFISGGPMVYDRRFKEWKHVESGVWYLKTADLRIFGWFPYKDRFIAAVGASAHHVKTHNLYAGHAKDVVRMRGELPLDEPKFIPGGNPNDVISF